MKKLISALIAIILTATCLSAFAACDGNDVTAGGELILRISNVEDYIATDEETEKTMVDDFEEWYEAQYGVDITVEYSTFGTPEILYNNLKINPGSYDLVCPSDYMIQKMKEENMLDTFDNIAEDVPNYWTYGSEYIKDLFEKYGWTNYSVPYMWGTMGFVYNPQEVTTEDASTWACVLNEKYKNKTTIKDSVRDTFFLGIALNSLEDLKAKNKEYAEGAITKDAYQSFLSQTFNDTSEETVNSVEKLLKQAKNNAFSLEVDTGKDDMVTGKVWLNFAWSGDAVYAMDQAEVSGTELCYAVPVEGSNVWFDGWVMPKGANKKLASAFLNYISDPDNACTNMDYIGYTSAIAGEKVYNRIKESDYACSKDDEGATEIDLTYFFGEINGERAVVYTNEENRQLLAQYPTEEITARCTVMEYFNEEANDRVNSMWNRVKAGNIWLYLVIIGAVIIVAAIAAVFVILAKKGVFEKKVKKGFKRVS